jgi:hypothetical protein
MPVTDRFSSQSRMRVECPVFIQLPTTLSIHQPTPSWATALKFVIPPAPARRPEGRCAAALNSSEKNCSIMRPPASTRTLKRAGMRLFGILAKAVPGASCCLALE